MFSFIKCIYVHIRYCILSGIARLTDPKMVVSVPLTTLLLTATILSQAKGQEVRLGGCVSFQGDPSFDNNYIQKVSFAELSSKETIKYNI